MEFIVYIHGTSRVAVSELLVFGLEGAWDPSALISRELVEARGA